MDDMDIMSNHRSPRIILFGCGCNGKKALHHFGKDAIAYFCDNDTSKQGKKVQGIEVISVATLQRVWKDYIVIVTLDKPVFYAVEKQLSDIGIPFLPYSLICKEYPYLNDLSTDEFLASYPLLMAVVNPLREQNIYLQRKLRYEQQKGTQGGAGAKKQPVAEFYLVDAFEVDHLENLRKVFMDMGIEVSVVAEPAEYHVDGDYLNYEDAVCELEKRGIPYQTACNPDADFALTTQFSYNLGKYSRQTKRIHYPYGVSYSNKNFGTTKESMEGFDYHLIHGKYDKFRYERVMPGFKTYIIGYPRYWGIDRNAIKQEAIKRKLKIETSKPILGYLPTWDERSSIQAFYQQMLKLKKDYFIVVRPHHCTWRLEEKKEDLLRLEKIADVMVPPTSSFLEFSRLCDVMLSDIKSGASLEAIYLNPQIPTIWLSPGENLQEDYDPAIFDMSAVVDRPELLTNAYVNTVVQSDPHKSYRVSHIHDFYQDISREEVEEELSKIFFPKN